MAYARAQQMISARPTVLVDGNVGGKEFLARGLRPVRFKDPAMLEDKSVRAVVFAVADVSDAQRARLVQKLRRQGKIAAQRGALIVVLAPRSHQGAVERVVEAVGRYTLAQMASGGARLTQQQLHVLPREEVDRAAEAIARHDPGPPENAALAIIDQSPAPLRTRDEETDRLLRRAFCEFEEITIRRLAGGFSGDGVWSVLPRSADQEIRSPFIVKCGSMSDMDEHIETYLDFVADRVPFRGCAPLCVERCVRGSMKRLAVTRFVEHADPLDEVALDHDIVEAIGSIYSRTLFRWRAVLERTSLRLFEEYLPKARWEKYRPELDLNYRRLRRHGKALLTPARLARRLYERPAVNCPLVRAHNDLNIRNVFVCGRHSEAVLIDFTSAKKRPLAFDIARLDVGLGFDDRLQAHQPIPSDVLIALYADDPFRWSLAEVWTAENAHYRIDGILHLRSRVLKEAHVAGYDVAEEYAVALCSSLLWYARSDSALARTAYECAARLADRL